MTNQADLARYQHDPPATRGLHRACAFADDLERAGQVDVEDPLPVFECRLQSGTMLEYSCTSHETVDAVEHRNRGSRGAGSLPGIAQVGDEAGIARQVFGERRHSRVVANQRRAMRARGKRIAQELSADAGIGTRDHDPPLREQRAPERLFLRRQLLPPVTPLASS